MAALAALAPKLDPHAARVACVLLLIFGTIYALINPPFAASNELFHLARARELSLGQLRVHEEDGSVFSDVPAEWSEAEERYGSLPEQPRRRYSLAALETALTAEPDGPPMLRIESPLSARSPLAYCALVPGLWLARGLGLPLVGALYAARLTGLLACCGLIWLALRLAGCAAWALLALALTPALVTQAGAASPDSLIAALALLFLALLEHTTSDPATTSDQAGKRALLISVFAALVACHPACAVFGLTLPQIGFRHGAGRLARWGQALLIVGLSGALAAAFAYAATGQSPFALSSQASAQLEWAAAHPLALFTTLRRSLFRYLDDYMLQFFVVREVLSGQMRFSAGVVATLQIELIVLLALGSAHGNVQTLPRKARWYALSAALFIGCVFLAGLLSASKIGPGRLQNIYGRLFFPAGPFLVAALAHVGHPVARRWLLRRGGRRVLAIVTGINLIWLGLMTARFYAENRPPWKY